MKRTLRDNVVWRSATRTFQTEYTQNYMIWYAVNVQMALAKRKRKTDQTW